MATKRILVIATFELDEAKMPTALGSDEADVVELADLLLSTVNDGDELPHLRFNGCIRGSPFKELLDTVLKDAIS